MLAALKKLFVTLLLLLILATATVAVLAQCDMVPFDLHRLTDLLNVREHLVFWSSIIAGLLVLIVVTLVVSSHRAESPPEEPEPTELDMKAMAEAEEEEAMAARQSAESPTEDGEGEEPSDMESEETAPARPPEMQPERPKTGKKPSASPRGLPSRRLVKIACIFFLCLLGLLALTRLVAEPLLKWRILATLSKRFKCPVEVGRSKLSMITGWAEAEDVKISTPPGYEEPFTATIRRVEARTSPYSLLFGTLKIEQLEVWDLDLRIEIQGGEVNLEALFYNYMEVRGPGDGSMPPPAEIENILLHNAKVTIVDEDTARLVFDKAEIEAEQMTMFLGLSYPVKVRSESTFEGGKGKGSLRIEGTVGPVRKAINLDLTLEGEKIDVRDMAPYITDISTIIGGHKAHVDGKFICQKDVLDGTNLVIQSSGGEIHAIELTGLISEPQMSGTSKLLGILMVPLQKVMRVVRKVLLVDKKGRSRNGRGSREREPGERKPRTGTRNF